MDFDDLIEHTLGMSMRFEMDLKKPEDRTHIQDLIEIHDMLKNKGIKEKLVRKIRLIKIPKRQTGEIKSFLNKLKQLSEQYPAS